MKKRVLSVCLSMCMMLTMLPFSTLAVTSDAAPPTTKEISVKTDEVPTGHTASVFASAGVKTASSEPAQTSTEAENAPTSGTCGENLTWELDLETGTLTISGSGEMSNYGNTDDTYAPWYDYRDNIYEANIGDGVTSIGANAFAGCWHLADIHIPEGVASIGSGAFRGCDDLSEIRVPDSVHYFASSAFSTMRGLVSINIPDRITGIESYTFNGCISLTNITIPASVTYIRSNAFQNCMKLESITIPDGITTIDYYTFSGCSNLTSISIPASVEYIMYDAFANCSNLTDIYYAGSDAQWSNINIGCYLPEATIHYNSTGPNSGTPDGRNTVVKYLASWDEASKTAVFSDDSYIVSVKAESGLKSQSRYEILILEKSKDFSRILIWGGAERDGCV